MRLAVAILLVLSLATAAEARPRHHHHHAKQTRQVKLPARNVSSEGRPRQCFGIPWCGCWLRVQKGISDVRYNAAAFWHNFGTHVAGPVVGAIARFNHHVGVVVGVTSNGDPVVKSGNHNHAVGTAVYPKRRVIEYRM